MIVLDFIESIVAAINSLEVNLVNSIFRLILSMVLGMVVGAERKRKGQIAGIRTFALISMGACLAMLLSIYVPQVYLGLKNGDPGRIAAQVITGIGFLGGGAMIHMKGAVKGLTTAAGIWMVATIGLAVGVGLYFVAFISTVLIIIILTVLEYIDNKIHFGGESRIIRLLIPAVVTDIDGYRRCLRSHNVKLVNVYVEYDYANPQTRLNLVTIAREHTDFISLFEDLRKLQPTSAISLANTVTI